MIHSNLTVCDSCGSMHEDPYMRPGNDGKPVCPDCWLLLEEADAQDHDPDPDVAPLACDGCGRLFPRLEADGLCDACGEPAAVADRDRWRDADIQMDDDRDSDVDGRSCP